MKYWLFALRTSIITISSASAAAQVPITADTSTIPRLSQAAVRLNRLPARSAQVYFIADPGREGMFKPDLFDRSTPDDSAMTLVTASGTRLKRVVDGRSLNVDWFGA